MLRFEITRNKKKHKLLKLIRYDSNFEYKNLKAHFKKPIKGARHSPRFRRGSWDGMSRFLNTRDNTIPYGLWMEVYDFSKKHEYDCEIIDINKHLNLNFKREDLKDFSSWLLKNVRYDDLDTGESKQISPRDYQSEAAFRGLRYKECGLELATSAGKTLIFYLYNAYLKATGKLTKEKKSLLIVPRVQLVNQTATAFQEEYHNGTIRFNLVKIGGKNKYTDEDIENADLVITTWQSLLNKDKVFFKQFDIICCDEAHISKGPAVKTILRDYCAHAEWKLGLSGTLDINSKYDTFYTIIQNLGGPLLMKVPAKFLIDNNYAPVVKVNRLMLQYDMDDYLRNYEYLRKHGKDAYNDIKDWGRDMFEIERKYLWKNKYRLNFISSFTKALNKNTLILFSDVKHGYGKSLFDAINGWNDNTFYIDGDVEIKDREFFKHMMETTNDTIIISSYNTFSTGINLKNVYNIIFAESCKSEVTIRQSIGRGMRKIAGKYQIFVWDLVDCVLDNCYSIKHAKERMRIYNQEFFEIDTFNKKLVG